MEGTEQKVQLVLEASSKNVADQSNYSSLRSPWLSRWSFTEGEEEEEEGEFYSKTLLSPKIWKVRFGSAPQGYAPKPTGFRTGFESPNILIYIYKYFIKKLRY